MRLGRRIHTTHERKKERRLFEFQPHGWTLVLGEVPSVGMSQEKTMTDSPTLVTIAERIIGLAQFIDAIQESDEIEAAQHAAGLEELFTQFVRESQAVVSLGVVATFDQKLQAMFAHNYLGKVRYLLGQVRAHRGNTLFSKLEPAEMVGEGFENVWQYLIGHDDGGDLYVTIDRLLSLLEVKNLERFDLHHEESHWQGADRTQLWESGEHDIYDWR